MSENIQLGRYQIETHLGSGSYADVYRAQDTALKRIVALKVLRPAFLADQEAFERFVQEAQVTSGLFHPHIATVLDLGEAEGRYFIAMRYVEGAALSQILKERGPLPWAEALPIAEQVASALDFAHGKGLVHRDIKPSNILISPAEGAVLTDFGLVKALESSGLGTRTGSILGTPQYIPPEVWHGEPAGPAADQYALACILVEMLSGQVLFEAPTPWAIMAKHTAPLELPQEWPQGTPAGLEAVLSRALAKEPGERYASIGGFYAGIKGLVEAEQTQRAAQDKARREAEERARLEDEIKARLVAEELARREEEERVRQEAEARELAISEQQSASSDRPSAIRSQQSVGEEEVHARDESEKETFEADHLELPPETEVQETLQGTMGAGGKAPEMQRRWVAWAAGVVILLAIIVVGAVVMRGKDNQPVLPTAQEQTSLSTSTSVMGQGSTATKTPEVTPNPRAITPENIDAVQPMRFFRGGRWIESVAFSPDGRYLGYAGEGGIWIYDLVQNRQLFHLRGHTGQVHAIAFSADSTRLYSGGVDDGGGRIRAWDLSTGGELWSQVAASPDRGAHLDVSHDGRWLVSVGAGETVLWQLGESGLQIVWKVPQGGNKPIFSPNNDFIAFSEGSDGVYLVSIRDKSQSTFLPTKETAWGVAISPDSSIIASGSNVSGSENNKIWLWRVEGGELFRTIEGLTAPHENVAFSPSGEVLASGSWNGEVRLWLVSDGSVLRTFQKHSDKVTSLAFSPDGTLLATGSDDGTVWLWGVP